MVVLACKIPDYASLPQPPDNVRDLATQLVRIKRDIPQVLFVNSKALYAVDTVLFSMKMVDILKIY